MLTEDSGKSFVSLFSLFASLLLIAVLSLTTNWSDFSVCNFVISVLNFSTV